MRAVVTRALPHRLLLHAAQPGSRWSTYICDCSIRHVYSPPKAHVDLPSYLTRLQARRFSQDIRSIIHCTPSYSAEETEGQMGDAKSASSASSSSKRRRPAPAFYAVRVGRIPGIYHSWEDTKQQTSGYKNPIFKKFSTLTEAEAFYRGDDSSLMTPGKPIKYYGVQLGHVPGVYYDYNSVLEQIRGFSGAKHRKFDTLEEAQAFVNEGHGLATTHSSSTPISLNGHMDSTTPSVVESRKSTKKQKQNDSSASITAMAGEYEAGMGPLPPDAEDGFDRTIKHGLPGGPIVEYKSEDELNLRKLQPTGDFEGVLEIYTDGASKGNGQLGAYAGFGIWFGPDDPRNDKGPLPGERQTNQRAELTAIARAIDIIPIDRVARIYTDSHYSMKCLTEWYRSWEAKGWKNSAGRPVENRDLIEPILSRIREREMAGALTHIEWVKAHAGTVGNEAADRLANQGAEEKKQEIEVERLEKAAAERAALGIKPVANGDVDEGVYQVDSFGI